LVSSCFPCFGLNDKHANHDGGKLREGSPSDGPPAEGRDEYLSDPSRPVPYEDKVTNRKSAVSMTADQRFASRRPDVLVFTTDVLEGDVTIAGPIQAEVFVSTTGTDSDYVVKVIDVYPDDHPDPMPNPWGGEDGRLPAVAARRRDARQVP
jgi:predicted acyl esterase